MKTEQNQKIEAHFRHVERRGHVFKAIEETILNTEITCQNCEILKRKLREVSEILMQERADREGCDIAADFDNTSMRLDTLYRERGVTETDEISARLKLLPLRAKLKEIEARTANFKEQKALIGARTGQAVLNQHLTRQKIRKMELENEEREAMIELYRAAVDVLERVGTGQMVEADFVVLDSLKQIGVKIPKKLKSGEQIQKQTNREGVENAG
ncbi:hypothetical protein F4Y93_04910 [Candidatus Poribacteria bacterium]|nr:hypothetical protein [Candidatus Poribacteria bacterium]